MSFLEKIMYVTSFDGTKIYYKKYSCKNPLGNLLLVHGGFQGNHTRLNNLIKYLKDSYNIIIPDLRGKGDSDFPKGVEKVLLKDYAKDLCELLKKEKISKINVIGTSFGGLVTLKFAEIFDKEINIEKIVLISSIHRLDRIRRRTKLVAPFYNSVINLASIIAKPLPEKRKEHIDYSNLNGRLRELKYGVKLIKNNSLKTTTLRHKMMKAARKYKLDAEQLKKINSEILVIHGKKDLYFPLRNIKEILDNTNSEIKIIKKAGHNLFITHAEPVSQMIKDFFLES